MKKFLITMAISILTLGAAQASIFVPVGPVTFKLDAIVQDMPFQQIGGRTNQSATATNTTAVFKATIATTPFTSSNMVALLANSFNTNFPAGSQIGMRFGSLFVLDSTGTNIIFTPNGVVSFQFDEAFFPEMETRVITQNAAGTHESGSFTEVLTSSVSLSYDDTASTTGDNTHTKFAFKGFYTVKLTGNLKTGLTRTTLEFRGTGGGPVRDVPTILTGTISGKASGTVPTF